MTPINAKPPPIGSMATELALRTTTSCCKSSLPVILGAAHYGAGLLHVLARRTLQPIEAAHEQRSALADVSHECITPLTALKMETEVTLLDPQSTRRAPQDAHDNLEGGRAHGKSLINNLLLLSTMEAGKLRSEFTVDARGNRSEYHH